MDNVSIKMKNCFGINELDHNFVFSDKKNAYIIYARNGVFKTSFAKTLHYYQKGETDKIQDLIFGKKSKFSITGISNSNIFVIESYDKKYEAKITSLLIDATKQKIYSDLKQKYHNFLNLLQNNSGLKQKKSIRNVIINELENTLLEDFGSKNIFACLASIECQLDLLEVDFASIKYADIFNDTTQKIITKKDFQEKIEAYVKYTEEINSEYKFFKKGVFTLPRLKKTYDTIKKNNFFTSSNKIILNTLEPIEDIKSLENEIKIIEERIKKSDKFKDIYKQLDNVGGLTLKTVIDNNPEIINYLKNEDLDKLKKDLWLSYINANKQSFEELQKVYHRFETEIKNSPIENTEWYKTLDLYKDRFTVPYKMKIENFESVITDLTIPAICFEFENNANSMENNNKVIKLKKEKLDELNILSQGEKRALYLLNIIFDVERIKKEGKETLFVIDDIADSFDYQNKFAIVEYLYDLSKNKNFYFIILTHNFDFFRTIKKRLNIGKNQCLSVQKNSQNIKLRKASYIDEPFTDWKKELNKEHILALIPFVRNIIEYSIGTSNNDYILLTSLLHFKEDTKEITFEQLESLYTKRINTQNFSNNIDKTLTIYKVLLEKCESIVNSEFFELEYKIILSIGIRLLAEEYMIYLLNKKNIDIEKITSNQTCKLLEKIKENFENTPKIKILNRVNLITPECIHLNSFMYEPIMDMDIVELKNLYKEVKDLKKEVSSGKDEIRK